MEVTMQQIIKPIQKPPDIKTPKRPTYKDQFTQGYISNMTTKQQDRFK